MTPLDALLAHPDIARLALSLEERPGVPIVPGEDEVVRWAAIALVVRTGPDGHPELLMIKRAEVERDPWSGHVACPGGRMEPGDHDLAQTAIRETWEETGVDLATHGRVIGQLDDLAPRSPQLPPIVIRPFAAVVRPDVEIVPSSEVAEAFWVPLPAIRERAAWGTGMVEIAGMGSVSVPAFLHGSYTVWGLTERVLREFLGRIEEPGG